MTEAWVSKKEIVTKDQMKYYKKELDDMDKWVDECNITILDGVEYFMGETNAHMSGISTDVVNRVKDDIKRFKQKCNCYNVNKLTVTRRNKNKGGING